MYVSKTVLYVYVYCGKYYVTIMIQCFIHCTTSTSIIHFHYSQIQTLSFYPGYPD